MMSGSKVPNFDTCELFRASHFHNFPQYSHIVGLSSHFHVHIVGVPRSNPPISELMWVQTFWPWYYSILFVKFSDVRGLNKLRSNASIQVRIIKYYNIQIRKTYLKIVYNLLDKTITIYLFHVKHYILFYNTNTNFSKIISAYIIKLFIELAHNSIL